MLLQMALLHFLMTNIPLYMYQGFFFFFEMLVSHLFSLLALQLKWLFLAPTTVFPIYWPAVQKAK